MGLPWFQLVKNSPEMQETWVRENPLEKGKATCFSILGLLFPGVSAGKESTCNAGELDSIPGLGRSPGEEKGYPLQHSGLENSMDCTVLGPQKLDTTERLSLSDNLTKYTNFNYAK